MYSNNNISIMNTLEKYANKSLLNLSSYITPTLIRIITPGYINNNISIINSFKKDNASNLSNLKNYITIFYYY